MFRCYKKSVHFPNSRSILPQKGRILPIFNSTLRDKIVFLRGDVVHFMLIPQGIEQFECVWKKLDFNVK